MLELFDDTLQKSFDLLVKEKVPILDKKLIDNTIHLNPNCTRASS